MNDIYRNQDIRRLNWEQKDPESYVKPDMNEYLRKSRNMVKILGGLACLSFIGFVVCGVLIVSRFYYNVFPIVFIPFGLFALASIASGIFSNNVMKISAIIDVAEKIKTTDKIYLDSLPQLGTVEQKCRAVQKLIDTGNLSDYRIISNKLVAKNEIYISEREVDDKYEKTILGTNNELEINYCPDCGYKFNRGDRFCSMCGRRLN